MAPRPGCKAEQRAALRAALIYQHASGEADRQIADRLGDLVDEHQRRRPDEDDGDAGVVVPIG